MNYVTKQDLNCDNNQHVQPNHVQAATFIEKREHHDTMFVCSSEDELNFDQFETDVEYDDDSDASALDIQNVAASLIGEHDCIFSKAPPQYKQKSLKLMVTTESNAFNQAADGTIFKAELMVDRFVIQTTQFDDDVTINCPKSGTFLLSFFSKFK